MRGAARLYMAHVALAFIAAGLITTGAALVVDGQHLALPSAAAFSYTCREWLARGGPGALIAVVIAGLALSVLVLAIRSFLRQVRASRRYLGQLPVSVAGSEIGDPVCQIVELDEPLAFCAGYLCPRVYLSRGALERLSAGELRAVLAHEGHHRSRRDPLRLLTARTIADAFFFLPIMGRMSERYSALGELAADEAAVSSVDQRGSLASALLKFSAQGPGPAAVVGIAPERVDHLMGDPDANRWRLPGSPLLRSALALALLAALIGLLMFGAVTPSLEPPLVVAVVCMSAMICGPVLLGAGVLLLSRRVRGLCGR